MFPRPARRFKTSVVHFFFSRAPRKFKTSQTIILFVGPAEMQSFGAALRQIFYSFKHGEVVGPQYLQSFIRSAKFIDGKSPEFKKHGGGDGEIGRASCRER